MSMGDEENKITNNQDDKGTTTEETKAAEGAAEGDESKPKKAPWWQRRIDQLTAEKNQEARGREEIERKARGLEAALEAVRASPGKAADGSEVKPAAASKTTADGEEMVPVSKVEQLAAERAAIKQFNDDCNKIYDNGIAEFDDFKGVVVDTFAALGGIPPHMVEAAMETGVPHKVLYEIAQDPDEAQRLMSMTPARMAVALTKIAAKFETAVGGKKASNLPKPIKPIGGQTKGEPDPEKMSTDEWMKWRDKKLQDKRSAA